MERKQPLLHRLGDAGANFGTKPPRSKRVRLALQIGLAVVVFGFLGFANLGLPLLAQLVTGHLR